MSDRRGAKVLANSSGGRLDIDAAARGDIDPEMQRIKATHGIAG
ncbi:MAG: hypothetical protein AB7I79_23025 [Rhizobiaceae bacterium]